MLGNQRRENNRIFDCEIPFAGRILQPNVITRDKTAGVQTGEMVRVTKTCFETLHNMPRGFFRSGQIV